jgi:hypothetical protein
MRVMLPALALLIAACSGADKVAEATDGAAEAEMPAGELAELEKAISDSTVAEVVADDPGGRLADAQAGPAMADPLASSMPEAPVVAPDAGQQAAAAPAPAGQ